MSTYNHETYDLQADVDAKFPKIWKKLTIDSMPTPQENPSAVLLGGQPGAGKSFGTQEVSNRLNGNAIIINGDEFRPYRAGYEEIYKEHGKDASKYTSDFSGAMVQKVRDEAVKQKLNIILEGTFRTSEIPLKEAENFKRNGYTVDVVVCTCPKETSWQSTIERGDRDKDLGLIPRYTPKEHHDLVVQNLPQNADKIFQSENIRHFEVYSRTEKLFDNQKDIGKLPSQAISRELERLQPIQETTGKLLSHGTAPYPNSPTGAKTFFAEIQNSNGENHKVWGKGVQEALIQSNARHGDIVHLAQTGNNGKQNTWKAEIVKSVAQQNLENARSSGNPETIQAAQRQIVQNHSNSRSTQQNQISTEQNTTKTVAPKKTKDKGGLER